jgi:hypothetical protein
VPIAVAGLGILTSNHSTETQKTSMNIKAFIFYNDVNDCDITFLTVFILTHPVNFPCGRKPEHPEKTQDFRQSVDSLFSHESVARIEPTNSEVKDSEAPFTSTQNMFVKYYYILYTVSYTNENEEEKNATHNTVPNT